MDGVVNSITDSFESMGEQIVDFLPKLLGALLVVFVGVLVAKLFAGIVRRAMNLMRSQKTVNTFLQTVGVGKGVQVFVGKLVYWVTFLVFFSAAVEVLELEALSETVDEIVGFAPEIFSAALVAGVTYVGARILRDLVESGLQNVDQAIARPVGIATQVLVMVFGLTTALAQLDMDLSLITANITVLFAGVVLALAIAFGFGGQAAAARFIDYLTSRKPMPRKRR